ncbi:MAG: FtsK/SpoIIIE domain-containing protein [Desulfatirhabdiaceae bacterium]
MPVHLNISRIRNHIFQAAGISSEPDRVPSHALLGRMFHESVASFIDGHIESGWKPVLAGSDSSVSDWSDCLETDLFETIVGPRIIREQVYLRQHTRQVMAFWIACKSMCRWIAEILIEAKKLSNLSDSSGLNLLISPEEALSVELSMPEWTDSVILSGVADLFLQMSEKPVWCVVELKLGQSCPEADLAQACLYHLMLTEILKTDSGTLALVRFTPERQEHVFSETDLLDVKARLMTLIGEMAGVTQPDFHSISDTAKKNDSFVMDDGIGVQRDQLISIFQEYGMIIEADGLPVVGSAFIRYPIRLGRGVKLASAQNVSREIQHRMNLNAFPFVHLQQGRVVVDIQRKDRQPVVFQNVVSQLRKSGGTPGSASVILGIDLDNRLQTADLGEPENAHILIAGTTGSGKSEWIRTALAGLILTNTPQTLRLVIIDPKRCTFTDLRDSPFLLTPQSLIYPDEQRPAKALEELADEMDNRYRRLEAAGFDSLGPYVLHTGVGIPRIICVCDEYADIINRDRQERKEVETQINRLGQKARSVGIHLIVATQHPGRQTIKGALDANLPARIALKMNRDIESKMIIGQKGAENLLGNGDMLFKNIGEPERLQSPLLSPEDRQRIFCANFYAGCTS